MTEATDSEVASERPIGWLRRFVFELITGVGGVEARGALELAPGATCPVCSGGLEAFEKGVRCDRCSLIVRELPSLGRAFVVFVVALGLGLGAGWLALPYLDERGL